jgi:hypothetical protein
MYARIITIPVEGLAVDERTVLCAECAAVCARIAGVQAHEWTLNAATNTISGVLKWSEYEAIAMGTETLRMEVAHLYRAALVLRCRDLLCPARRLVARRDAGERPNTGFVHYPQDYDPRG